MTAPTNNNGHNRRQIQPGDGRTVEPVTDDLKAWLEDTWSDVLGIRRKAHLLMGDIEDQLDTRRGTVSPTGTTITLRFSDEGLEVTKWLVGQVWRDIADIEDKMLAKVNAIAMGEADGRTECVAEVDAYNLARTNHSALFTAHDNGEPGVTEAQVLAALDPMDNAVIALCRVRPTTSEGTERRRALLSEILPAEVEGRREWSQDVFDALLSASGGRS